MISQRTDWPVLVACIGLLAALQLYVRPLLPVDETRYLSVAWEMWSRGDFLVPWLNGEPYSHKPPLLFWFIQGLWGLFGVSETAARLLPVVFSLIALWWSAVLAVRLWPMRSSELNALVPWVLFGGVFWMNFYTLVQFDLLLVLAALGAWLGILHTRRSPVTGWIMVSMAFGLGVLAKGPVITIPVLPAILLAPWWMGPDRPGSWIRWYAGAALAVASGASLALAWAVPAAISGGDAYREAIFWGQTAGRMVESFAHRAAWWSYFLWLPLMWLPWIVWPPVWRGIRQLTLADSGVRFCLAVLVPCLIIFSLISGKQGKYLLPLFPVIACLLARGLVEQNVQVSRERLWPLVMLLGVLGLVLTLLALWPDAASWLVEVPVLWGPVLLLIATGFIFVKLKPLVSVRIMVLVLSLGVGILYMAVIQPMSPAYRLQALSERLATIQADGHAIAWLGKYHGQFHFLGRLRQPIEPLPGSQALREWLKRHPDGYVLVKYPDPAPRLPEPISIQPYRGGSLTLWPTAELIRTPRRLDDLAGNA